LSFPLLAGEKIAMGGLALKTLKKLKGLRFLLPSLSTVLAKAMGLGPIDPRRYACSFGTGMSAGIIRIIFTMFTDKNMII
jgi:uncharacterized membrane protein YczE